MNLECEQPCKFNQTPNLNSTPEFKLTDYSIDAGIQTEYATVRQFIKLIEIV